MRAITLISNGKTYVEPTTTASVSAVPARSRDIDEGLLYKNSTTAKALKQESRSSLPGEQDIGTSSRIQRCERMIRSFAYALILVQVSMATALLTQVFLTTSEEARSSKRWIASTSKDDEGCAKAMWPNIPDRCLKRVEPKVVTLVLSQNN